MPNACKPEPTGRYWGSANRADLTEHPEGDATVNLQWADGAELTFTQDSHAEARATLARLGFGVAA